VGALNDRTQHTSTARIKRPPNSIEVLSGQSLIAEKLQSNSLRRTRHSTAFVSSGVQRVQKTRVT